MIKEAQSLIHHYINAVPFNTLFLKNLNRNLKRSKLAPTRTARAAADRTNQVRRQNLGLRSLNRRSSAMAATASDSGDNIGSRTQQSPLASQRAKANNAPTEANRTGRFGGYFTLGYKEGFSQWVGQVWRNFGSKTDTCFVPVGKCVPSSSRAYRHVLRSVP